MVRTFELQRDKEFTRGFEYAGAVSLFWAADSHCVVQTSV
jgi:hypothetical protein